MPHGSATKSLAWDLAGIALYSSRVVICFRCRGDGFSKSSPGFLSISPSRMVQRNGRWMLRIALFRFTVDLSEMGRTSPYHVYGSGRPVDLQRLQERLQAIMIPLKGPHRSLLRLSPSKKLVWRQLEPLSAILYQVLYEGVVRVL